MNERQSYDVPVLERRENLKEMTRLFNVVSGPGPASGEGPPHPSCIKKTTPG